MARGQGAGRPRAVLAKANRLETAQSRQALGTLTSLRVRPKAASRYQKALEAISLSREPDDFDMIVNQFVETCWQEEKGGREPPTSFARRNGRARY